LTKNTTWLMLFCKQFQDFFGAQPLKNVASIQEEFLFAIHLRASQRLKTNQNQNYHYKSVLKYPKYQIKSKSLPKKVEL
jgi:hypothetical protein